MFWMSLLVACATHTNPPVTAEPAWDSPRTRELAQRACFDCHSNQTVWPWYSSVPLVGASVAEHVTEGRQKLNFSEWDRGQEEADEAVEVILEGEMPPGYYTLLHGTARLTAAEQAELVAGLRATLGAEGGEEDANGGDERGRGGGDEDEDEDEGEEDDD